MKIKKIDIDKIKSFSKPTDLEKRVYGEVLESKLLRSSIIEALKLILIAVCYIILLVMFLITFSTGKASNDVLITYTVLAVIMLVIVLKQSKVNSKLYNTKDVLKVEGFKMADCIGTVTKDGKDLSLRNLDNSSCNTVVKLKNNSKYINSCRDDIAIIVLLVESTKYCLITSRTNVDE